MADKSAIEWTDATWNVVTGCTKVSPGCARCYIDRSPPFRIAGRRFERVGNTETTGLVFYRDRLEKPLHWTRPRMIFVNSLSDMFHEDIPPSLIAEMWAVMRDAPQHTFQILTKRPERMREVLSMQPLTRFLNLPNVWLGVSVENSRYTSRADILRDVPAAVRFISAEPLLGSVFDVGRSRVEASGPVSRRTDSREPSLLRRAPLNLDGIDWLIAGGESGPGYRPVDVRWVRELRDACVANGTAFYFKQFGGRTAKAGGKVLDGREWCQFPLRATG